GSALATPQSHGFEGLILGQIAPYPPALTLAHLDDMEQPCLDGHAAPLREHRGSDRNNDEVPNLGEALRLKARASGADLPYRLDPAPDALVASVYGRIRTIRQLMQLDVGVQGADPSVVIAPV